MLQERCEEVFKTAYANVRLNSDAKWTTGIPDKFREANLDLWVRHNIYTSECTNNGDNFHSSSTDMLKKICSVRDSIPVSCVAQLGNYEYNEIRERLYAPHYTSSQRNEEFSIPQDKRTPQQDSGEEQWMTSEVEEEFKRITCVDSVEDHNSFTQQLSPVSSSRLWNTAREKGPAPRQFATFETRSPGIKEKYNELSQIAGNSEQQTPFPEHVAGSSGTHLVEQFKSGLLPVPCHTSHSPEEVPHQSCTKTAKDRQIWDRQTPTISPYQSQGLLHLQGPPSRRGNVISTVSPSDSFHPLSHRPHAPILSADNTNYFTESKVRSTFILNDDHEDERACFPTALKNYQSELLPYASVTATTTSFTSYDHIDTETTLTVGGLSALNKAGTTAAQQSSDHLWFPPQHAPPTYSLLCRRVPQPPTITTIQQHSGSTLFYTQSHNSAQLYASSFCHQTPASLTNRSDPFSNSNPEYQRPTEFYDREEVATGQGGCGEENSELIFLNTRGTNHRVAQSKARREEPSISRATVEIPASEKRCRHPQSQPHISGQELFSGPPKRTIDHSKQELESNNNLSLQSASRTLLDVTVSEHVQTMETQFMNDTKVTGPTVTKISVLSSETQHNQKTEKENVRSESKQEKENPSSDLTLTEREHFPPCAATDLKRRSSSPIVNIKAWTPFQTSVSFVIPHPVSSPVRVAGKSTASTPDCSQRSVNKSRKLYRDVLKRETTAAPSAAISDRYEELEQQDPPAQDKRSESFQQQQRAAEDSNPRISDVTGPKRQVVEQCRRGGSSTAGRNDRCISKAPESGRTSAGGGNPCRAARVVSALPASQSTGPSDLDHYMPSKEPFFRKDKIESHYSEEADSPTLYLGQNNTNPSYSCTQEPRRTDEGISSSNTDTQAVVTAFSLHTRVEVPGATPERTAWVTPNRRRNKKSSKSLAANVSAKPLVTTAFEVTATVCKAGGEEGRPSRKAVRIKKNCRRIRKEPPLDRPTDLVEIQARMEEPHVVAAPEHRCVCQTGGPSKVPRLQKATGCNTDVNVVTATEGSTKGGKGRRKRRHRQQNDKQSGLINCSIEGGKAKKEHQRDRLRKNSEEQHTQISEKFQIQSANIHERDRRRSVPCNNSTSATIGCVEIPEGSTGHGHQCHETSYSNSNCHRDALTAEAVSVSDHSEQNKTHEESRTENRDENKKRPSGMRQGKKQRAARKKKKSKKRGACCDMNIKEPDPNYNLSLNVTDLGSACNLFEENYESSCDDDANQLKREQHYKTEVISDQSGGSEEVCNHQNEPVQELEVPANSSNYYSANETRLRPKLRTIQNEELREFLDYDSLGTDLVKYISKRRFICAKDLPIIDHFIFLQLGSEELKFRFQNSLRPICMVSYEFLVHACPHKYLIHYFWNSEIANVPSADREAQTKWSDFCDSNSWNRSLLWKARTASLHQITAQVLSTASQMKMEQLLKEFKISTLIQSFYQKCGLTIPASKGPYHETKGYFFVSDTGHLKSKINKTENKLSLLRVFNFFKRSKIVVHIGSAKKNKDTPQIDKGLSKMNNDSTVTSKLELQSSHQKTHNESSVLNKGYPENRKLTSQSEKIKGTCSVPCLSSCNNQTLPEPDTFHDYFQQPHILSARISKKLPVAGTAKENASSDDLPPSSQVSQEIASGKRPQPTHGMSAVSPTNVHAARTSTTSKSSCEVSSDEKYEMGVVPSKKICERHLETKHKTPPIPFEVSREPAVSATAGQRSRTSATETECDVALHMEHKMAASISPTLRGSNSCNSSTTVGQPTDIGKTSSTEASSMAPQDLPFPCKTTQSAPTMPSVCGRQTKSERAEDADSEFTTRHNNKLSCLLL